MAKHYILKILVLILLKGEFTQSIGPTTNKGLKDYHNNYFTIGVAIKPRSLQGPEAELILNHFSSITPENASQFEGEKGFQGSGQVLRVLINLVFPITLIID